MLLDALLLAAAPSFAYTLRFEGIHWGAGNAITALAFTAWIVPIQLLVFYRLSLYRRIWYHASVAELELISLAGIVVGALGFVVGGFILPHWGLTPVRVPISVMFTDAMLGVAIVGASRLFKRTGGWRRARRKLTDHGQRTLIVGAGAAGNMLVTELRFNPGINLHPVGFVDDNKDKHGRHLSDLPVFGALADVREIIRREEIEVLVIALPSAAGSVVRPVVRAALDAGITTRTVPALSDILAGHVSVAALRQVEIHDLLRRERIETNLANVATLANARTVLVTGAGGSIGSELCRQLAQLCPTRLVLLGHGENPIFEILHELRALHPTLEIVPVIADIRDGRRIRQLFDVHRPYAVFHAAAHKHVPLMEENVIEAVTNNVIGTKNVVDAAVASGATHFVLISTDKAVRPTNVMGATKRVAEHIVHEAAITHRKNFVAVRFGNVLGSQGSVVPTFVRQIKSGGPVTVTHPEMRRYFMTIPESVQLVLQAGALGKGGELFMLDMGEPIRIVDLARDLIRLSGLEEGADIEIRFTGIRPGEKLYEEMFFSDELAAPTDHPKVLRARKESLESWGSHLIGQLIDVANRGGGEDDLRHLLRAIVPDFVVEPVHVAASTPGFGVPVVPIVPKRSSGGTR
jgi:FlaA1/EpsC-like NDP-sugar epimerase